MSLSVDDDYDELVSALPTLQNGTDKAVPFWSSVPHTAGVAQQDRLMPQ